MTRTPFAANYRPYLHPDSLQTLITWLCVEVPDQAGVIAGDYTVQALIADLCTIRTSTSERQSQISEAFEQLKQALGER